MYRLSFPLILLLSASVSLMGAEKKQTSRTTDDLANIKGKWQVYSVQRDGKPQHGEVGQEVGDVITVELNEAGAIQLG